MVGEVEQLQQECCYEQQTDDRMSQKVSRQLQRQTPVVEQNLSTLNDQEPDQLYLVECPKVPKFQMAERWKEPLEWQLVERR